MLNWCFWEHTSLAPSLFLIFRLPLFEKLEQEFIIDRKI